MAQAPATSPDRTAAEAIPGAATRPVPPLPPSATEGGVARRRGRHARPDPSGPQAHAAGPAAVGSPLDDPQVASKVEAMLAQLAAEPHTEIDGVLARFHTQGARIALMLGGTAVLTLLLFLVLFVVGLVLE
jgi:hypothetical protein